MKKTLPALIWACLALCSCQGLEDWLHGDRDSYRRVFMVYSAGYNNLSGSLKTDLDDILNGAPDKYSEDVLVVFSHQPASSGDYETPTNPVVYRVYSHKKETVRDTIRVFPSDARACDPSVLEGFLGTARDFYPAQSYGLLISSHALGWIPDDYEIEENPIIWFSATGLKPRTAGSLFTGPNPQTKSLLSHFSVGSENRQMDLDDFADAITYKLDFLIMDCCLMGGVESLYAIRDKVGIVAASPTEVLSDGYCYESLNSRIFCRGEADVVGAASDFFAQYYPSSSCTAAVYDMSGMDGIASACRALADKYHACLDTLKESRVQNYSRNTPDWYYDMEDIFRQSGADSLELSPLDSALDAAVVWKACTKRFIGIAVDSARFCAMSMYLPHPEFPVLDSLYRETLWNRAVGIIR